MKLIQMQYFQMVCKYNSVSRAAEELHISQPTISNSIRELEDQFGIQLFHRIKKRLVLTKEGEYFLHKVHEILKITHSLDLDMASFGRMQNIIKLGVPPMIGTMLFPSMFGVFKPMYPEIQLDIYEHGSKRTIQLMEEDALDMAIVITNDLDTCKFNVIDILETQIVLCAKNSPPWSEKTSVTIEELEQEPLILLKEDSFQNSTIKQHFSARGIRPNIIMYSNQMLTLQKFVTEEIAKAFLFQELVTKGSGICGIPLNPPIQIQIGLIWKKERQMYSSTSKFIDFATKFQKHITN